MMTRFFTLLIALLACSMAAAQPVAGPDCTRPLMLALHDHGLLYSTQSDSGIDKDIVDELIRRSGCKFIISVMPRTRIWELIEAGVLDFSLSGITSEARDKFAGFAWYFSSKYFFLVRKDANVRQLADFEKNPKLIIGVQSSYQYSQNAKRLVDALKLERRVEYATQLEPLYQILKLNRIQGMIVEPFGYSQIEAASLKSLTTLIDFNDESVLHGLIMSKKSVSLEEQQKWRALVNAMRADGTVQHIFEKYFNPRVAKSLVDF